MDLDFVCSLAEQAGRAIADICCGALGAEKREEASGLARRIILEGLHACRPDIPVIMKENKDAVYPGGEDLPRFWLVDPFDGPGEGNGEFTVDIALVEGDGVVFGAVYAPLLETLYFAGKGAGCWKKHNGVRQRLTMSVPSPGAAIRVVVNRSHISPDTVLLIDMLPSSVTVARDSALKFCAIAENEADFYPQMESTREWETAAGQIIVTEAGGVVMDLEGKPLTCNKADLLNGPFLVAPSADWLKEMDLLDCRKRLAEWQFDYCAMSCR